jgi:hypothetical protein
MFDYQRVILMMDQDYRYCQKVDRCESSHLVRLNLAANKNCLEDSWEAQNKEVEGPLLILACETATKLYCIIYMYIISCSSLRMLHDEPTKVHQYSAIHPEAIRLQNCSAT